MNSYAGSHYKSSLATHERVWVWMWVWVYSALPRSLSLIYSNIRLAAWRLHFAAIDVCCSLPKCLDKRQLNSIYQTSILSQLGQLLNGVRACFHHAVESEKKTWNLFGQVMQCLSGSTVDTLLALSLTRPLSFPPPLSLILSFSLRAIHTIWWSP